MFGKYRLSAFFEFWEILFSDLNRRVISAYLIVIS